MSLLVGELFVKLELDSSTFSKSLKAAEAELRRVAKDLKPEVFIDVKVKEQASINVLKQQIQIAQSNVNNLSGSFTQLGSSIRTALAVSFGNLLTQPLQQLLGMFPAVVGGAANFEQELSNVAAVAGGLTQNQLEALRQKALQIGADTSLSATQATQAFQALVANGIKVDDQFNQIADSTVALKEAVGGELTTAANVLTDVIQNFPEAAKDVESAVNGITGVTVAGKFQINDYALALANGGVQTAGLGVSLKDFNAVIAATSSAFNSGQTAGTSFRMFVQSLTPNTKVATQAMKELGLITANGTNQFYDSQGALKSQVEIFAILEQSFAGLTEQQKAQYAQTIFGADGANVLTAALRLGSQGLQKYADEIEKVSAADIAATRLDNFNGAVEQLKGSLDTAGITIGSLFLPALTDIVQATTQAVNALVTVINAVNGNEEAFNKLSPVLQTVVVAIQDVITYVQNAVSVLSGVFQSGIQEITSFFDDLISMAFGWGANIGDQFGNGILASLGSVISAVQELGSVLEYWMSPGSPPRMAKDLDKWGRAVGQVYVDEIADADISPLKSFGELITSTLFSSADLGNIKTFTDEVQNIIGSLVDSGSIDKKDSLSLVLGTRDSFTQALAQLRETGSVSASTFGSIIDSAGMAGDQVQALASTFFALENASQRTTIAQNALTQAQQKLSNVQRALQDSTQQYRDELEKIQKQQELLDIDAQIKEQTQLANAIGGDGSVQAKAQKELIALALKRKIVEQEIAFQPAIDAAEQEIIAAESALEVAKEQEAIEKERYDLIRQQIEAQIEQNKLLKEQIELAKPEKGSGGGGGGSQADVIDKDKAAQDAYNYSLADTDGKLAILKQQLAGVREGSAEYYRLLGQIGQLENQKAKEQEKIALEAQKQADEKAKAERDYQYSIADTKGKLEILRGELANVEEGSAEYYKILKDINQLEQQEKKPKGGAGGSGIQMPEKTEENPVQKTAGDIRKTFEDAKLAVEEAKNRVETFRANLASARQSLTEFVQPFIPIVDMIRNNFVPVLAAVATPAILALGGAILTGLGGALAAILSPIALVSVAVGLLVAAWQMNFGNIQGITQDILGNISELISNVLSAIQVFWDEHGTQVMATVSTAFNTVKEIVSTVMQIVLGIIRNVTGQAATDTNVNFTEIANVAYAILNAVATFIQNTLNVILAIFRTVLAGVNGDWSLFWNELYNVGKALFDLIANLIRDTITVIASLFGVKTEEIQAFWQTLNTVLTSVTKTLMSDISKAFTTGLTEASKLFENTKKAISDIWDKLKSSLPESTRSALGNVGTALTEMIEGIKSKAISIGTAIIDGIKKGIRDGIEGLKNAAVSVAQAAIDAAKSVLKIQSPSKVMEGIGTNYTQGFVEGVTGTNMLKDIDTMFQATIPTFQPQTVGMQSSITNYYEFTIDARGSTMNENEFRTIIKDEVNKLSQRGNNRGKR